MRRDYGSNANLRTERHRMPSRKNGVVDEFRAEAVPVTLADTVKRNAPRRGSRLRSDNLTQGATDAKRPDRPDAGDRPERQHERVQDRRGGRGKRVHPEAERLPGDCLFSLVQFDHLYEFVHKARRSGEVETLYALNPRGNTALLDAVAAPSWRRGSVSREWTRRRRPGLVVFVIVTDGQENASREFTRAKIKEMIEHQQSVYKWQFTYLGANQDAFAEAGNMGIPKSATTNYAEEKTSGGILAAHSNVARMRHANATGAQVRNLYTDAERSEIK